MKKVILSVLLIGFTACIFAQSSEDNSAYVPNIEVEKNQGSDNELPNFVEPSKDTIYCCQKDTQKIVISSEQKQMNSQDFYRQEQQKQLERTRSLYNYGAGYYTDRAIRYGFQVATQTIFPF